MQVFSLQDSAFANQSGMSGWIAPNLEMESIF